MSPLRDSDLTPAMRERLRAMGVKVSRRSSSPTRAGSGVGDTRGRCGSCGEEGPLLEVERHADAVHHGARVETILEPEQGTN